jgi:hypothetical protein
MRVPSMMSVPGVVSGFGPFVRPLYEHIREQVAAGTVRFTPPVPGHSTRCRHGPRIGKRRRRRSRRSLDQ